ncbi:adenosine deaminase [Subtercola endophyticus]|uniref:adenosine deaminase n=1 Tax=Subtercola endophyticus TaxID=2895559 RepID=UPI001E3D623F|nr:adenosine deaminase [Subtercola endophyticus]UFS60656.1 adenosine deaminase [Subtercola endophyticus]
MSSTRDLLALPKAHLHAHLDGSYPVSAVQALAERRGAVFTVPDSFDDVWAFFHAYGTVPSLVHTHEDLAALCRALVHAEAAEGVLYLEPAIEPQLYAPRLGSILQVTTTIVTAFAEAAADAGIEVGSNLNINTDQDFDIAEELARAAAHFAGAGVTALGTAGFIEPGNLARYTTAAEIGLAAGLPVVSHAGQTGGPASVEEALDLLHATRISHGFRAIESAELVQRLADEQIVCDITPVSNVRLGVVTSLAEHPAPRLIAAGVPVTLNADDSLWFSRSVTDQYRLARESWGFTDAELAHVAATGMLAAGMSSATRNTFRTQLDTWEQS